MSLRVLIVQSDGEAAQQLASFFTERGDQAWVAPNAVQGRALLDQHLPNLLLLDLHLPESDWQDLLQYTRQQYPATRIIGTNNYPVLQREARAQELGVMVVLRKPFTDVWIENALRRVQADSLGASDPLNSLSRLRIPMGIKITLPYALLALLFAMSGAYLVSRVVLESIEDRFNNQLIETGKLTADWVVEEERRLLATLRLLANTEGVAEAVAARDGDQLREVVMPVAVNYGEEAVEFLDMRGVSLFSARHQGGDNLENYAYSQGDNTFAEWDFVQRVLAGQVDAQGDKYAGLAAADWGSYFYVAGPVIDDDGDQVGVVLVGKTLRSMVRQIRRDILAQAVIYDRTGQPLVSTLSLFGEIPALVPEQVTALLDRQDGTSLTRDLSIASVNYSEIVGPLEVRAGEDLGLVGAILPQAFLVRTSEVTRVQIYALVTTAFLLVIGVGIYLAYRITKPLLRVVEASAEVAHGNLNVKVEPVGNDEVADLAHSFNAMVTGLREGSLYRDLLGRTVSPEVREQLRQTVGSGHLRLEGQEALATVLMADIQSFTALAENVGPTTILAWLNDYFAQLVPIITAYGGVVNKFDGDALLAFFGILPRPLPPSESAYLACRAVAEMLKAIDNLNARRVAQGEPPFVTGIGINTGPVAAGGLGAADRLHYTIIGDTVNVTQRLETLTRQFGESSAVISHYTYLALGGRRSEFSLEPRGFYTLRGKSMQLAIYRLWPSKVEAQAAVG